MKRFRLLPAMLVVIYTLAILVAAIHTHPKATDELQCKLCHFSGAALILATPPQSNPQQAEFSRISFDSPSSSAQALAFEHSGRAPPASL